MTSFLYSVLLKCPLQKLVDFLIFSVIEEAHDFTVPSHLLSISVLEILSFDELNEKCMVYHISDCINDILLSLMLYSETTENKSNFCFLHSISNI